MLTNEEMEKIKFEEIFRNEIRKKLSENEHISFSQKSWLFINSSFGIWLMSSVIVGSIVYFYNSNKLQNEILANNTATIQKLETEASNRLQQFKSALSNTEPSKIYYQKDELTYMIDGILIGDGVFSQKKPIYIFSEYKDRTMNSLLYEIGRLRIDKEELLTITDARTILKNIQLTLLSMEDPPRFNYSLNQMVQQKAQSGQPLSTDEKKQISEYEKKREIFEKEEMALYNTKIKVRLGVLLKLFDNNIYLKTLLEK